MRVTIILLIACVFTSTLLAVEAQNSTLTTAQSDDRAKTSSQAADASQRPLRRRRRPLVRPVIPPATVLHNPEFLSGEASVSVAANSNPLIRIGIAQNGVTLIEFPASDKFFAVHSGNSDLVTVEKSPSLKRDHHLILRAGSGFLVPSLRARGSDAVLPATSIIAQMDSGMAITVMIYPVPFLKQQAHRLVINYKCDEVIDARRAAGLATNLTGSEADSRVQVDVAASPPPANESAPISEATQVSVKPSKHDFSEQVDAFLKEAISNPNLFKNWSTPRHGLRISAQVPQELSDTVRLVLLAVKNTGNEPLRLIGGYPDLYVETINENGSPVEAGTKVEKLSLASSRTDNLISPGMTRYFALAYEAPILGAQQHLKLVVAHMNAADEPATADLTAAK